MPGVSPLWYSRDQSTQPAVLSSQLQYARLAYKNEAARLNYDETKLRHSRTSILLLLLLLLLMLLPLDLPVLLRLAPRRVRVVLRLLLAGPRPSSSKVWRLLSSAAAALAHCRRSSRTIGLLL